MKVLQTLIGVSRGLVVLVGALGRDLFARRSSRETGYVDQPQYVEQPQYVIVREAPPLKAPMIVVASLVLLVFLGLAGCGEDRRDRFHNDRDRSPERYERHDSDRHEDRGGNSGHEGERGDR